ncbi:MAG TPA: RNA-dependent DNA polymerase [Cyanobacteria bacterium UBA11691]|nr:RNA-dependent DNA polymerase [Cyanobacteria bacterium UBA11691]
MSDQPRTRQELYDRIRKMGREAFILEEMIRYGFWPEQGELPQDPADEIRRRSELYQQLSELRQKNRQLQDEQAIRRQLRKQRLAESRRKREETKQRREEERQARAQAWQERQQQEIVYLGEEVSGGLGEQQSNLSELDRHGLPQLATAADIAQEMGITLGELRFLAFDRKTATVSHYIRFKMPKKTRGERLISVPMPRLKRAQYWILSQILEKIPVHEAAHGFCRDRSIITNATPHVRAEVVINLDLKDFFPSISYRRVKGLFRSLGYSEAVATILALICTAPDVEEVSLDGQTYYIALNQRHLPQGSPASPAISNLICRRLDQRLTQMVDELGFTYTRYADDLTFSASGDVLRNICRILRRTESIIDYESFTLHPEKTRILRRKSCQLDVTGIVVNEGLNIDRKTLRKFRATLHQIETQGLEGKHWGHSGNVLASIQGFANFVTMVNPEKGAQFQEQVSRIRQKYGRK